MTDTSVQPIDWNSFRIPFNSLPLIADPSNSDPIEIGDILGYSGNGTYLVQEFLGEGGIYAGIALTRALPGEFIVVGQTGLYWLIANDTFTAGDLCQQDGSTTKAIVQADGTIAILGAVLQSGVAGDFLPVNVFQGNIVSQQPSNKVVFGSILNGDADGTNTSFTTATNVDSSSLEPAIYIAVAGASPFLRQVSANVSGSPDYTFTAPNQIEFTIAPVLNSILIADYVQE